MKPTYPLDPDQPDASADVEARILESLTPLPLPEARGRALASRLQERIRASRDAGRGLITLRRDQGHWAPLVPGVRVKRLSGGQRAVLLDLAPGAVIPFHRHHEDEECVVLRGSAQLGDVTVHPGDYHLATTGSRHGVVRSETGALLFLGGTPIGHGLEVARDVVTALLPGRGQAPLTVPRDEGPWTDPAPGLHLKLLRDDGHGRSLLVRLEAGCRADLADLAGHGECLMVEGEAFAGDTLLQAGDYQLAPQGVTRPTLSSDVGGLLFVRTGLRV